MFTKTVVLPLVETQLFDFLSILVLPFSAYSESTSDNVLSLKQPKDCDSGVNEHPEFITAADGFFFWGFFCL